MTFFEQLHTLLKRLLRHFVPRNDK